MDLKRMMREKQFWLAVALAAAGMLMGASYPDMKKDSVLPAGTFLTLAKDSLRSRTVFFLLPITAVLPCGDVYIRERQWNFLRLLIIRRGKTAYSVDKMITTAFSGALVWILGAGFAGLLFFLLFFGKEEIFCWSWEPVGELLTIVARTALTASAFASFSAVCGVASGSVYLAMGLPFVLYYMLMILRERYLPQIYCMDPSEWIKGEEFWGSGQRGLWIFLILLAVFFMVIHGLVLEKKLEEI